MHFRSPDCRGGHYGTDQSGHAHGTHNYFPTSWGQALVCLGWTEGEAAAAAVIEAARQAHGAGRLEVHPGVLMEMSRMLLPDSSRESAEMMAAGWLFDRLYGIPLIGEPSLEPGEWRIVTDSPPDPPVGGQVPRLEGDMIIMNWHHKGPAR